MSKLVFPLQLDYSLHYGSFIARVQYQHQPTYTVLRFCYDTTRKLLLNGEDATTIKMVFSNEVGADFQGLEFSLSNKVDCVIDIARYSRISVVPVYRNVYSFLEVLNDWGLNYASWTSYNADHLPQWEEIPTQPILHPDTFQPSKDSTDPPVAMPPDCG